jgi:hypothetical protein
VEVLGGSWESHDVHRFIHHSSSIKPTRTLPPIPHVLSPLAGRSGIKGVVVATSDITALVAEARVAEGLDSNVCAPGVLLYTVDTTIETGNGPIRVLDANPSSGGCSGYNGQNDELNDATLSLDRGANSYEVEGWGFSVQLLSHDGEISRFR